MRYVGKRLQNKKEFGQCIVIVSWAVTIVWITLSFILAFMDKSTNSEVTIELVRESFGVTLAYFLYQAALKMSRNKHGVDRDGIPFKVKQQLDGVVEFDDEDSNR